MQFFNNITMQLMKVLEAEEKHVANFAFNEAQGCLQEKHRLCINFGEILSAFFQGGQRLYLSEATKIHITEVANFIKLRLNYVS